MKSKKNLAVLIVLCAVILTALGYEKLLERLIKNKVVKEMKAVYIDSRNILSDGKIHVILSGTGSPRIGSDRSHPCTAVVANGQFLIFDAGPGAVDKLSLQGYPIQDTEQVFLTHMHSDHMGGIAALINLSYNMGRRNVVHVYGPDDSKNLTHSLYPPTSTEYNAGLKTTTKKGLPDTRLINQLTLDDLRNGVKWGSSTTPQYVYLPGVGDMVYGINKAYLADTIIRTSSKQIPSIPEGFAYSHAVAHPIADMANVDEKDQGWGQLQHVVTFPDNGSGYGDLVVKAFLVDHYPCFPSYGYRIEYAGKSIVISGDTESLSPHESSSRSRSYWTEYAQDADILVHEASSMKMNEIVLEAILKDQKLMKVPVVNSMANQWKGVFEHHTGTLEIAKVAQEANVKKVLLTHILTPTPNFYLRKLFVKGMDDIYSGEIVLAEDGMDVSISLTP